MYLPVNNQLWTREGGGGIHTEGEERRTERQRERQRETEGKRKRQSYREIERGSIIRQTDKHTKTETDRQSGGKGRNGETRARKRFGKS